MVDYNIAVPQQQLYQAPDMMQNAMRMQQMQVQNAQMQEIMRTRQEQAALRNIPHDPNSPEFAKQAFLINPELGIKVTNMQRQNALLDTQTRAANLSASKTTQDIQSGHMDLIRKFNDEIPGILAANDPAAAYAPWLARLKQIAPDTSLPDQFPGVKALSGYADKAEAFLTRSKPQLVDVGKAKAEYTPGVGIQELNMTPSTAGSAGAGAGPAIAVMNPDQLAKTQATQERLNLPLMQSNAAGANAAVNNMPGAVPTQPPVGNAMLGGPAQPPAGAPSPYGAPISSSMFARQQEIDADAQNLEKQRNLEVMKRDVAANAPPAAMNATQERAMLNTVSKDRSSAETTVSTMGDVLKAVKDVQDLSEGQKNSITGITSKLPRLTAESRTAQTKLNNLKGIVTQMGKRSASLGGALGNMAVQEWKIVGDGIASLDVSNMNAKDLNDQLDIIAAKANAAAARTKDAYERQYEDLNVKHKGRFALSGGTSARGNAAVDGVDTSNPLLR